MLDVAAPGKPPLRALLEQPKVNAHEVWDCVASESGHAVRQDARGHVGALIVLHIIAQLTGWSITTPPSKAVEDQQKDVDARERMNVDEVERRHTHRLAPFSTYALHMRLPSGDYFTNGVSLEEAKAQALDTGAADLVSIAPRMQDTRKATLGERLPPMPGARSKRMHGGGGGGRASAFLSYGPFGSSLGPSFDSSGCLFGPEATQLVWTERQRVSRYLRRRWGASLAQQVESAYTQQAMDIATDERSPTLPTAAPAQAHSIHDVQETSLPSLSCSRLVQRAVELEPTLDPVLMESALHILDTDEILAQNQERLDELQELQWLRVRMDNDHTPIPLAMIEREQRLAEDALHSLVDLVRRVPPSALGHTAQAAGPLILMSHVVLITSLSTRANHDILSHGYWGTLPDTYHGAKTQTNVAVPGSTPSLMAWAPLVRPAVVADNTTAEPEPGKRPAFMHAYEQYSGSPAAAVRNAMVQPRPVPPYPATAAEVQRPLVYASPTSMGLGIHGSINGNRS